MDHDKLAEEIERVRKLLHETDPASSKYEELLDRYTKLCELEMKFNESCDKQLERQEKLSIDRDRSKKDYELKEKEFELKERIEMAKIDSAKIDSEREFELKEKELEIKSGIEMVKIEDGKAEAEGRKKIEKKQAWFGLLKETGKVVLLVGGQIFAIIVTGKVEQGVIIGQHSWSLIPKVKI